MLRAIIEFLMLPYRKYQEHRRFKKRMKDLQERDPFIYK